MKFFHSHKIIHFSLKASLTYKVVPADFSNVDSTAEDDILLVDWIVDVMDEVIIVFVPFNISCTNEVLEEDASDCVTDNSET